MQENVLLCEDSMEGVFTGIYDAYAEKMNHKHTRVQIGAEDNLELFADYRTIIPDDEKAGKVARTLQREFGTEGYLFIHRALASYDTQKGQAIYQTVVLGLTQQTGRKRIMEQLGNPYVRKVFELSRNTQNELHRFKEFLRFEELENGILYGKVEPKNHLLTLLMPHFTDRLPLENFMIHDTGRELFGIHPAGKEWYLFHGEQCGWKEEMEEAFLHKHVSEDSYQELFRYFCHKIAIKERTNLKLQQNMLPLRFRKYMTEFQNMQK